jgi:hypothetical protein
VLQAYPGKTWYQIAASGYLKNGRNLSHLQGHDEKARRLLIDSKDVLVSNFRHITELMASVAPEMACLQYIMMPDAHYQEYIQFDERHDNALRRHMSYLGYAYIPSIPALEECLREGSTNRLVIADMKLIGPRHAKALRLFRIELLQEKMDNGDQALLVGIRTF